MKNLLALIVIIPLIVFFGCGKEEVEGIDEDRAAIESLMETSPYLGATEHYGEEDIDGTKEEIIPICWWRGHPTTIERDVHITIVGDSAFAEINTTIYDTLYILAGDSIGDTTLQLYTKFFIDHGKRYAVFKRDTVANYHRGWRLYALSGVDVTSEPNTVQIDSIKIDWGDSTRVITDILKLKTREEVLTISPDEVFTISVYTNDTTALVFLHTWRGNRSRRWRLHHGHGRFHGYCRAALGGIHHIAVDIMTHSTLFDSDEPYDSNTWIIPYRIE